jgi:hypothetical protein
VTVVVVEEQVNQSRAQQRPHVDSFGRVLVDSLQEFFAIDDLERPGKAGGILGHVGIRFDHAQHAGKFLAELAQALIVRHQDENR